MKPETVNFFNQLCVLFLYSNLIAKDCNSNLPGAVLSISYPLYCFPHLTEMEIRLKEVKWGHTTN